MNVNQLEDESGPNAALLFWSTQADPHLTENFLIALWSCSINSLALAIICPCFLSFERGAIVRCATKPRQSLPQLWAVLGVWMLLIYRPLFIKIFGADQTMFMLRLSFKQRQKVIRAQQLNISWEAYVLMSTCWLWVSFVCSLVSVWSSFNLGFLLPNCF